MEYLCKASQNSGALKCSSDPCHNCFVFLHKPRHILQIRHPKHSQERAFDSTLSILNEGETPPNVFVSQIELNSDLPQKYQLYHTVMGSSYFNVLSHEPLSSLPITIPLTF
jgi:hypothetical protein